MKRLLIAMEDSHQSQKLAIVLSNSYESVTVDSAAKLRSYILNLNESFFSIIFEDSEGSCHFSDEIFNLEKSEKLANPSIQIIPKNKNLDSTNSRLILKKPFGVKELMNTINLIEAHSNSSNIAIA